MLAGTTKLRVRSANPTRAMAPLLKSSRSSSTPSLKMTPFWGMCEVNAQQIGAERIEQGRVLDALQDPTGNGLVLSKLPPALKCGGFPADLGRSPVSGFGFNDRQFCDSVPRDCQSPTVSQQVGDIQAQAPKVRSRSARTSAMVSKPGSRAFCCSSRSHPCTFLSAEMTVE